MGSTYFNKRIPNRTATRRPRVRPKSFKTEAAAQAKAAKEGGKVIALKDGRFRVVKEQL